MNKERLKKIERLAKELVSNFIFEELEDSEQVFGIITITGAKISSDFSYLDIYVSSFKNGDDLPKMLATHGFHIQKKLNKALQIRKIPKIRFRYDDRGQIGQEICEVINREISN